MSGLHSFVATYFALWGVATHLVACFVAWVWMEDHDWPMPWDQERRDARAARARERAFVQRQRNKENGR